MTEQKTIDVATSIGTTVKVLTADSLSELKMLGEKIYLFVKQKKADKFKSYGEFKLRSLLELNLFENQVSYLYVEDKSEEQIIEDLEKDSVVNQKTAMNVDFKVDWVINDLLDLRDKGADIVKIIWTLPQPEWAECVISRESTRLTDGDYIYYLGVRN